VPGRAPIYIAVIGVDRALAEFAPALSPSVILFEKVKRTVGE